MILLVINSCNDFSGDEGFSGYDDPKPDKDQDAHPDIAPMFPRIHKPVELNDYIKGKLAYKVPDSMKVGGLHRVTVSISQSLSDEILLDGLDTIGFKVDEIRVSSRMKVQLLDPSDGKNFEIIPLNSEMQVVDAMSNTIWEWSVKPRKKGNNQLLIRATIKIYDDLGEDFKDIPVFDKTIEVKANMVYSILSFVGVYWQWIIGTLLIPIIGLGYKVLTSDKKKRRK